MTKIESGHLNQLFNIQLIWYGNESLLAAQQ